MQMGLMNSSEFPLLMFEKWKTESSVIVFAARWVGISIHLTGNVRNINGPKVLLGFGENRVLIDTEKCDIRYAEPREAEEHYREEAAKQYESMLYVRLPNSEPFILYESKQSL
jgi:hypothetical protein